MREITINIGPGGNSQTVSLSGTSASSTALWVRESVIYSTVDCFVRAGSDPTAVTTDQFVPAQTWARVTIPEAGQKIAAITGGSTGTLYISPGA